MESIYKPYVINNWVKDFCLEYNTGFQIEEYLRAQLRSFILLNNFYPKKSEWFRWLEKERTILLMQKSNAMKELKAKEVIDLHKIITNLEFILNKDLEYRLKI